ncbi:2-polyprenyl-6-methoxyphenol hydroxylase-like FAD-dependent oxidoreductase [Tardiphaga robiniae]|uniref:FAD-dependent oxidoreductase n=1 Tax=Tardiphaga robiniae TaxID=943830 RepID=UPI00285901B3|nr:FAD-dependent oxidoreductase [Tardiphaga robiniae]MDR6662445.1 2-polyprenyl-6-methoxyphenol hydroxylase-like FAD-dependent oxidoreductase [Tardiphaga robiniae]
MQDYETSVVIVGAGPVGLTAALDLASRGIDVIVLETRHAGEPPNVKCNHVSARSMEVFRRLGIVTQIRDAGLPPDFPNDCSYRTTATGIELSRIVIPSRATRYTATDGPDTWWPTPEPPHRINQIYLEPVLFANAAANPRITILSRTEMVHFDQDISGVSVKARGLDEDRSFTIRARFLIGCDGGRSLTRKLIGASFVGTPVIQRVQSTLIDAPDLKTLMQPHTPAWMVLALSPRRTGTVVAIDGHDRWLIHNHLKPDEPEFDSVDRDWSIRTILGVGPDFNYEVVSKEDWVGRRLVADRFRDRRAFICGDAAHLWMPYAGYGMNAGIADAVSLCWMLAAHLNGWADAGLLDAYAAERQPITDQVSRFAMEHALASISQRGAVPAVIEEDSEAGAAARAAVGRAAYDLNVKQYCCAGLNFGYFYDQSPVIAYDGEAPPAYTMGDFEPSTVPGARMPHVWLSDGRSIFDAMGPGYTLLRYDPACDVTALREAARRNGVPLTLIDLSIAEVDAGQPAETLLLVRPDQHIAWRGRLPPLDPDALIDLITGRTASTHRSAAAHQNSASHTVSGAIA